MSSFFGEKKPHNDLVVKMNEQVATGLEELNKLLETLMADKKKLQDNMGITAREREDRLRELNGKIEEVKTAIAQTKTRFSGNIKEMK